MTFNKRRRITALLCVAVMLLSLWNPVLAEDGPAVTVNTVTAAPGETVTVSVMASDFAAVTALSLMVTYDTNALSLDSASARGCMTLESLNTKTAGFVQYAGVSDEGFSGDGTLFTITFTVSETAAEQSYSLSVLVTNAEALVDGAEASVSIGTTAGAVTVKEAEAVMPTLSFYGYLSASTVEAGSEVTYKILCNNPQGLAAGQFSFTYDSGLFEFKSLELLSAMTGVEHVSTINDANPGRVVLAYTADEAISSGYIMTLTLVAREDASGSGDITFTPLVMADAEGNTLLYKSAVSKTVTVTAAEAESVYPKLWLTAPSGLTTDRSFTVDVWLEGNSGLAAADFRIGFDAEALVCEGVSSEQGNSGEGVTVVINEDWSGGVVKFSMLCGSGVSADVKLASLVFRAKDNELTETALSSSAEKPVDANMKSVTLEYGSLALMIEVPVFTVNFIDWDGTVLSTQEVSYLAAATAPEAPSRDYTGEHHYVFKGWSVDFASVKSNLDVYAVYEAAAHSMNGWVSDGEATHSDYCIDCGYTAAADHDWGDGVVTAPTCTDGGYTTHTCTVCGDEKITDELPAAGHGWHNGLCAVCGADGMWAEYANGMLTLELKGFAADCVAVVAWYDAGGRMLGSLLLPITGEVQQLELMFEELPARMSFHCFDSLFRVLTEARDLVLTESV